MNIKKLARLKRAARSRRKMREIGVPRLCVHRTPQHIYAQLIDGSGNKTLVAASTLEKSINVSQKEKKEQAALVGAEIAKRILAAGITKVAFDRSGFKYHGRVRALADAARAGGLEF